MKLAVLILSIAACAAGQAAPAPCGAWGKQGKLLYADDFERDLSGWVAEHRAGPDSTIAVKDGKLEFDVAGGATAWFKQPLKGDVLISFTRSVPVQGGRNDRLSDFNMFWMASDPRNANLFTRGGEFSEYDGLSLYYAGIGGNTNTSTRLRKYDGKGERVLLSDLGDPGHLLVANRSYAVQIAVYRGCTRVLVDGSEYFSYRDPAPLRSGYFGFRTTQSRQQIDDFKIYQLD